MDIGNVKEYKNKLELDIFNFILDKMSEFSTKTDVQITDVDISIGHIREFAHDYSTYYLEDVIIKLDF